MASIRLLTGSARPISYVFRPKESIGGMQLACRTGGARWGVGEPGWLRHTPFLTVEIADGERRTRQALLAFSNEADPETVRKVVPDGAFLVALPGDDAFLVASGMSLPVAMVSSEGQGGAVEVCFYN